MASCVAPVVAAIDGRIAISEQRNGHSRMAGGVAETIITRKRIVLRGKIGCRSLLIIVHFVIIKEIH
jgi:hypothetical protein